MCVWSWSSHYFSRGGASNSRIPLYPWGRRFHRNRPNHLKLGLWTHGEALIHHPETQLCGSMGKPSGPPGPLEQRDQNILIEDSLIYNLLIFHDDNLKRVCFVEKKQEWLDSLWCLTPVTFDTYQLALCTAPLLPDRTPAPLAKNSAW